MRVVICALGILLSTSLYAASACDDLMDAVNKNQTVGLVEFLEKCRRTFEYNAPWTPLHEAALVDARAAAQVLLENGVAVNAADGNGFTPISVAHQKGHFEMVALLISYGGRLVS